MSMKKAVRILNQKTGLLCSMIFFYLYLAFLFGCEAIVGIESLDPNGARTATGEGTSSGSNGISSGSSGINGVAGYGGMGYGGGGGGNAGGSGGSSGASSSGVSTSSSGGSGGVGGGFSCPPVNDCAVLSAKNMYSIIHNGQNFTDPCIIVTYGDSITFDGVGLPACVAAGGTVSSSGNVLGDSTVIKTDITGFEMIQIDIPGYCSVPFYCKNNPSQHGAIFIQPL